MKEINKPEDFKKMKPSLFVEKFFNIKLYPYQKFIVDNMNYYHKFKRKVFN